MVELSQKVFGAVISQSSTRLGPAWADGQTAFKCMNASCPRVWMAAGAGLDGPEPVSVQLSGQPGRVLMNGSQQPRSNITLLLWLRLSAACISGWATADYIHSILFKTWFLIRSPVLAALDSFQITNCSFWSLVRSWYDWRWRGGSEEDCWWSSWLSQESLVAVWGGWKRTVGTLLLALLSDCGCVVAVVRTPAASRGGGLIASLHAEVDPLEQGVAQEAGQGQRE